ncbi:MAG: tryptophan 7-halogenase [Labilithrix sp.]
MSGADLAEGPTYDVAVVGGGPAGAVAAYVLARAGRRVVLIDAAAAASRKIGESLPAIAGHLLRKIGLAEVLEGHRPSFGNVSAWGGEELVSTDFIQDPHGLGLHLDRARFDRALREAARDAGAELVAGRVRAAERGASGWVLRAEDAIALSAACVIDATGRRASIAKREGARRTRDDELVALFHWARGGAGDERTLVESVADGWWYTAPLPDEARVFAFHTDASLARALRRGRGLERALAAAAHVKAVAGGMTMEALASGRFRVAEAGGARLDAFVGRGWVAVGDAALAFDPIAAQGIFNALYTGMKAGEAVGAALRGDPSALSAYTTRLEEIRAAYVARSAHVYDLEQRWPDAPFWRLRHGRAA